MKYEQEVTKALSKAFVGRKVKEIRYLTDAERVDQGFNRRAIVLWFDNGSFIFPMADDEGNDAGALATSLEGMETVGVVP